MTDPHDDSTTRRGLVGDDPLDVGDEEQPGGAGRTGGRAPSVVVVNTGDGKGKSSSAFGVMLRGWARGWRIAVVQCIKSGDWQTGEHKAAEHLGIEWHAMGDGFTWDSTDMERTAELGRAAWQSARAMLASGDYDLIILDELTYTVTFGWVDAEEIAAGVADRAPHTNVVVTGRDAPDALVAVADTVTDMRKVRHAFDRGVTARRGIEY
ncbi:MAG: cob(I)yrinic acid a,c-diamide adenosyltransferase [Acidimicrobiia bacterium]|nr:cob(I)yrinic acid a,c-diamide adenosyltransferase [Acidimicrobiia bacterium]